MMMMMMMMMMQHHGCGDWGRLLNFSAGLVYNVVFKPLSIRRLLFKLLRQHHYVHRDTMNIYIFLILLPSLKFSIFLYLTPYIPFLQG